MSEYALHVATSDYLGLVLTQTTYWTSIGHGGFLLTKRSAGRLKSMGMKPGCPDILLVHDGQAFFIELKTDTGRVSPVQVETHMKLASVGARVGVARSVPDVSALLDTWRIPHRRVQL